MVLHVYSKNIHYISDYCSHNKKKKKGFTDIQKYHNFSSIRKYFSVVFHPYLFSSFCLRLELFRFSNLVGEDFWDYPWKKAVN